jgi:hypothetical protein
VTDSQILREPPIAGDETATLLGSLEWQRQIFAWKCGGFDAAELQSRVGASTITLCGLLEHPTSSRPISSSIDSTGATTELGGTPWTGTPIAIGSGRTAAEDAFEELMALWENAVARSRSPLAEALIGPAANTVIEGPILEGPGPAPGARASHRCRRQSPGTTPSTGPLSHRRFIPFREV